MGETIIAMVFPRQITMFVYRDGRGKGKTMMKATSYLEGRRTVTDFVSPVGTELCPIELSSGRILAEDLIAAQNVPPFDRSPFDGYVFQAEDSRNASREAPVTLRILEEIPASGIPRFPITVGTASKILTGAPIPEGGDPKDGCWQHSAGLRFLADMRGMLRAEGFKMKLLVEDLGHLDDGVKNLLKLSGLPGMDIWQFSADEMMRMCEEEPEKAENRAFYTGTHDNNTLVGFLKERAGGERYEDRDHIEGDSSEMGSTVEALAVIRRIYESPAVLAMVQLQDVLMLGEEARMNVPGVPEGNWTWKMPGETVEEAFLESESRLKWFNALAERTGRKDSENGETE